MDTTGDVRGTAGTGTGKGGRLRSFLIIVVFDIAAPLVAYYALRSAGVATVTALVISGVFPAGHMVINAIRHRRLDVVGTLVLTGIIVGAVLGLTLHSTRPLLLEGSVPTVVFGIACLGSLLARRPLIYSLALEFTGPDSVKGREMTGLWRYEGYRRVFVTITAMWGVGFLIEAALRVVVVFTTSTGTAMAVSNVTPYLFTGILCALTVAYGTYRRKKAERAGHMPAQAVHVPAQAVGGATADAPASIPE